MLQLKCEAKDYEWGRRGPDSAVATLLAQSGVKVDLDRPWAELWMGTHPSGPSHVHETGELLSEWIQAHPEALGPKLVAKFGTDLPFLFKVLSVEKALSIQAHPDKELAAKLHAEKPTVYRDPNHKPEMALALEDFTALCGFRSMHEIAQCLSTTPELAACIGVAEVARIVANGASGAAEALRLAFTKLMTCDAEVVKRQVEALVERLESVKASRPWEFDLQHSLVLKLNQHYPGDVGVLASMLLNYVRIGRGEAIYLAANEPHAYLSGQIVEVMATSDNVVRAGLTPKMRDTGVLCGMLTYHMGLPPVLRPVHRTANTYVPPFEEFQLSSLELMGGDIVALPTSQGASILLIQKGRGLAYVSGAQVQGMAGCDGEGVAVEAGGVFLVAAGARVEIHCNDSLSNGDRGPGLVAFLASCNATALG